MTRSYRPVNFNRLKTYSVAKRRHKSEIGRAAELPSPGASARSLLDSFPDYLGATAFRRVTEAIVSAVRHDRPVVVAFGAHVLKVGCGPVLIDLIERGVVQAVACNGACAIHDVELAMFGETSEEVADTIHDGRFGMVAETMAFFDEVAEYAKAEQVGLGAAVGRVLLDRDAPNISSSVFAAAFQHEIPATVHVALGTDTVHVSGGLDGAALGAASMLDFRLICDVVSDLGSADDSGVGGVFLNVGSAVVLPEVFLKAVSVARNLGADLDAMTTANFDMMRHYRTGQNVVTRPVRKGRGHEVIGHHEILLPLLRYAVLDRLATESST